MGVFDEDWYWFGQPDTSWLEKVQDKFGELDEIINADSGEEFVTECYYCPFVHWPKDKYDHIECSKKTRIESTYSRTKDPRHKHLIDGRCVMEKIRAEDGHKVQEWCPMLDKVLKWKRVPEKL